MTIEQATEDDAEKILALQKLAYQSEAAIYDDYSIPPLLQTLEELQGEFTGKRFLKAVTNGEIVGSVRGYENHGTCFIGRLIVHPRHQNRGIGTLLMQAMEQAYEGTPRFEVFTGHRSDRNIRLYEKLGYRIFGTETVTHRLKLVYMEKRVD